MKKKLHCLGLLFITTISNSVSQELIKASDIELAAHYDVQTNGLNSTYSHGLTHHYVNGELRFLIIANTQQELHEFVITGKANGELINTFTRKWSFSGTNALSDHNGIWYESSKNRLWVTSSQDYTVEMREAHITLLRLNDNGSMTVLHKINIKDVPEKRMYGGCQPSPVSGWTYACGWGGYTSLLEQGGAASLGPSLFGINEPTLYANNSSIPSFRFLDAKEGNSRGYRSTIPVNYFDGGDPRPNPSTRPTEPPLPTAAWLSPNTDNKGWFVWGDSYYNTGMYINTPSKKGFVTIASLCKGFCWYQSSTLASDDRQYEVHIWDPAILGNGYITRPTEMKELLLPRGNTVNWGGGVTLGSICGATFDPLTHAIYAIGFPLGPDVYTGRLYKLSVKQNVVLPLDEDSIVQRRLQQKSMVIYPNPVASQEEITVVLPDKSFKQYQLFDITGKLVKQDAVVSNRFVINTRLINPGLYIFCTQNEKRRITEKIIIQ